MVYYMSLDVLYTTESIGEEHKKGLLTLHVLFSCYIILGVHERIYTLYKGTDEPKVWETLH